MRKIFCSVMLLTLILPVSSPQAADPAKSAPAASAKATPPASGSAATAIPTENALWQHLHAVQRLIPRESRVARPFASVSVAGAPHVPVTTIKHIDETGGAFRPVKIVYEIDGKELLTLSNRDGLAQKNIDVFSGRMMRGKHKLSVQIKLRGYGYGIFSYMRKYRATLETSETVDIDPMRATEIVVRIKEHNTALVKERFSIEIARVR